MKESAEIDFRELSAILAGLEVLYRHPQEDWQMVTEIMSEGNTIKPLSKAELFALSEKLNGAESIRINYGERLEHSSPAPAAEQEQP